MNRNNKKRGTAINRCAASSPDARGPQPSSGGENNTRLNKPKTPRKRRPRFVL
jgi:hypothetical protein